MRLSHKLLRNLHLATTPVLGAFVYAGSLREDPTFVAIVQWGVFPLVASAGVLSTFAQFSPDFMSEGRGS